MIRLKEQKHMSDKAAGISQTVNDWHLKQWMKAALAIAEEGVRHGENPFGAAIYRPDGEQVAVAHNTARSANNPSAHAEINAIAAACKQLGKRDLSGCWLATTAEPCPMCLSATALAGIRHIAFGANQVVVSEAGYGGLGINGRELAKLFSCDIDMRGSVLGNDCIALLLRNRKRERSA
ncbi:nucleoside deaminase [Rhodopirellula sp. SWK7]|uniref:nucleoside deaminase n=1 Tax=Rhodopirellula sp. SWK7 TaxID=595460 RepID=UPI0002BE2DB5|nr:nucleoside deaminase [Rhodopirellula sp. SWK7]EMI43091.1 cytidine and deoxycytidylate deaminase family protein [Rhodopirellula sp. SWK7]